MKRKSVISDSDDEVIKPAPKRQSLAGGKAKKLEYLESESEEEVKPKKGSKKKSPSVSIRALTLTLLTFSQ